MIKINFAAVVFVLGIVIDPNCAWLLKSPEFDDLFSIFNPKDGILSKIPDESVKKHKCGINGEAGEASLPLFMDLSPNPFGMPPKAMMMKSPKDNDLELIINMASPMDGAPATVIKRNKPNEKVLMSLTEMFIPFRSENMKPFGFPDLFNKAEFPKTFDDFAPFFMSDMALGHRHPSKKPASKRDTTHKRLIALDNINPRVNLTTTDPFESMIDFLSKQLFFPELKNFTYTTDNDAEILGSDSSLGSTKMIQRRSINSPDNKSVPVIPATGHHGPLINLNGQQRQTMEDDCFNVFPNYNLGYLTIIVPILAGFLATIIGFEIVRRNREMVCKKCPFSTHYNPIEQC